MDVDDQTKQSGLNNEMKQNDQNDRNQNGVDTEPPATAKDELSANSPAVKKSGLKVSNVKSLKQFHYPFILSNTCPTCNHMYKTRRTTVNHYKAMHSKFEHTCTECLLHFANPDHLKEHFMLAHENAPWIEVDEPAV